MANFSPKPIDVTQINGGNKYEANDGISPTAVNAPIEAALLVQSLATLAPIVTEIAYEESPRVEIEGTEPRFHFYLPSYKAPTNWQDIQNAVREGTIRDYLSIGDQIETTWNNTRLLLDVVAINADTPLDYANYKNSLTLQFHDIIAEMPFDSRGTFCPWSQSNIRQWLNNEFYLSLEPDLKKVIGQIQCAHHGDETVEETIDFIFLPSREQVDLAYPYYTESVGFYNFEKKSIVSMQNISWWARDTYWEVYQNTVREPMYFNSAAANTTQGVSPAFCIW